MEVDKRKAIISLLQSDILRLQRLLPGNDKQLRVQLGSMLDSFPNQTFPLGAVHEFLSSEIEDASATLGFVTGLLTSITERNGAVVWISASRKLFPPALKAMNLSPDRFIFLDLKDDRDVMWAMNEALKCGALSAVVGELRELSFTESRRLQLAVEQSRVTGFVLRHNVRKQNTTACVSRWRVTALQSEPGRGLPGLGFLRWKVELLRMRNGKTGSWVIQWQENAFLPIEITHDKPVIHSVPNRKAG